MRYDNYTLPPSAADFAQARWPETLPHCAAPLAYTVIDDIKLHLGGDAVLSWLKAHDFVADHDRVNFLIERPNPKGVHAVAITVQPHGMYSMHCYARRPAGSFSAPLLAAARQIVPENLATVLGQLAGIEEIHHRHFRAQKPVLVFNRKPWRSLRLSGSSTC